MQQRSSRSWCTLALFKLVHEKPDIERAAEAVTKSVSAHFQPSSRQLPKKPAAFACRKRQPDNILTLEQRINFDQ
jgi:hypothetical protein